MLCTNHLIINVNWQFISQILCLLLIRSNKLLTSSFSFAHLSKEICNHNNIRIHIFEINIRNPYFSFKQSNKTLINLTSFKSSVLAR